MVISSMFRNIGWNAIAIFGVQALQMLTLIVSARLLKPADFGLYATALIFINFFNLFAEWGVSSYLIQKRDIVREELSSIFWFNLFIAGLLALIFVGLSDRFSRFYMLPQLALLLSWSALIFIGNSFTVVPRALLERSLNFRAVAVTDIIACLTSSVLCIVLIISDFGALALVLQAVTFSFLRGGGYLVAGRYWPLLQFRWSDVHASLGFTLNLLAFNVVNFFARSFDQIAIGKWVSSDALGFYSVAYKLMLFPIQKVSGVFVRVLLPALAKDHADLQAQQSTYLRVVGMIASITFPLMATLAAIADDIVLILLGTGWEKTALLLKILAPVSMLQSVVTTVGAIYMARGRTSYMLKMGMLNSGVVGMGILLGLSGGVLGVAIGILAATVIMWFPNMMVAIRLLQLPLSKLLQTLSIPFISSAVIFGLAYGLTEYVVVDCTLWTRMALDGVLIIVFAVFALRFRRVV